MNILLVSHIYPPAIDGGSKVIFKIGEYFASQGHQLLVLSSNCKSTDSFVDPHSQDLNTNEKHQNIHRIPVNKNLRRPLKALRFFLSLFFNSDSYFLHLINVFEKGPIFKLFPFLTFLNSCIKFKPDLIIAGPLPTSIVIYARFIKFVLTNILHLKTKILINASFHPSDPDFLLKPLIASLQSSDYLWTLTDYETNYFSQNFNIPKSKLINVGNGVDASFITQSINNSLLKTDILYVGSFAAHKNIPDLIKAFCLISPNFPKLKLVLAGQSTLYSPQIDQLLNQVPRKLRQKITIINDFDDKKLSSLYHHASILVQPSSQESFGLTLIEAWASHVPVVCSDIPQFKELIKKSKGGLNFQLNNVDDLSQKITTLLNDPNLAQTLASNAYEYVKTHSTWDKIGESICQKLI